MTTRSTGHLTRRPGEDIRRGIAFAGLILIIAGITKVATNLGLLGAPTAGWSQRLTMAVIGAFLVVTGNAIPKTLTPLGAPACDPAAVQRFQRLGGWTWALTGLALAVSWLLLPLGLADTLTFVILGLGLGSVAVLYIRLHRVLAQRRVSPKPLEEMPCSHD